MSNATETTLGRLHGVLAETFIAEIEKARESGEPIKPSLLAAAARFLKDNGIDRPVKPGDPEDKLADILEEEFADDNVINFGRE